MVLKTDNLSLYIEGKKIFGELSLELGNNEFCLLRGNAGTGKTLAGITISGYLPFFAADWYLENDIFFSGNKLIQGNYTGDIGILFENPYQQVSGLKTDVFGELALPLECNGTPEEKIRNKVHEFSDLFLLNKLLDRKIDTLSGGELQRVLIAATLINNPKLIFFDRFFSEIDTFFRKTVTSSIKNLIGKNDSAVIIAEEPWLVDNFEFNKIVDLGFNSCKDINHKPEDNISNKSTDIANSPFLIADNIYFSYNKDTILIENLSFSAKKGDIIFIKGPNGSGKSTLAKIIAGIIHPLKGDIIISGKSYSKMKQNEIMQNIGMVFQNPYLHLTRTKVSDEFNETERNNVLRKEITSILGLDMLMESHPLELSNSQKKRLGLAIACLGRCKILILDEPTQYSDNDNLESILKVIETMRKEGKVIISITHDPRFESAYPDAPVIRLSGEGNG